jgi:tol-pal system protein YbgF
MALLICTLPVPAQAAREQSLEERLNRLERILQNQSLSGILLQVQRLQEEVQRLHGTLEVQEHRLEDLSRRQREQYRDLDNRIADRSAAPPMASPPQPAEARGSEPPLPATRMEESPAIPAPSTPPVAMTPGDPAKELATYQQAFDLLRRGDYRASITGFHDFLAAYPNGSYSDNAQYWLGEASYVSRDFDTAMQEFGRVLERYPTSNKVAGAMLKLGFIQHERGQTGKAREIMEQLIQKFPGSTEARLAQQRLELLRRDGR